MKKHTPKKLTSKVKATKIREPMRQAIIKAMRVQNMTAYELAKSVKGRMSPQTVYDFVAGRSDLSSARLWHLFKALGLIVIFNDGR